MADWKPYFVNIRDGVVVGTQDPDMPDGTYVRVDVLPSAGGSVWGKVMGRVAASQTIDSAINEVSGQRERLYLICKHGGYYRPNCQGYTSSAAEAGRYTLAEAISETHPNGPDGPRDGMSYIPAPADLAAVPAQVRVKPLVALVEELTTAVWHLLDNSETSGPIDDPTITVWQPDFDTVSSLLDRIEGLSSGSTDDMTAGELLSASILAAIEPQPDPRDEVIARLVEAATNYHNAIEGFDGRGGVLVKIETVNKCGDKLRAALAAAKAVQHG